jgi:hypothetical protein
MNRVKLKLVARGWESKSIESQMEAAEDRRAQSAAAKVSAEEIVRQREFESLQLSKIRVLRDIDAATNPRYRESLQAALRHLEDKIAALEGPTRQSG